MDDWMDIIEFDWLSSSIEEQEEQMDAYGQLNAKGPINCKFCGAKDLLWGKTENVWRLFKNGKIHTCKKYKPDTK